MRPSLSRQGLAASSGVVFTLPAEVAEIAFHNKAAVYDLLFRAASETMMTIAADPRHLGARIGITAVLHTWGSALSLARARELLAVAPPPDDDLPDKSLDVRPPCPCCGGHMIVIETFARWS